MTDFRKLQTHAYPVLTEQKVTEDSIYWKHLQFPVTIKQNGAVSSIDFSPVEPYNYLVSSSTKVQLFSARNITEPSKSYHRFNDLVHSASFRGDGQLFVVGCEDHHVRVVHKKHFEQVFHGHSRAVHVTRFVDNHSVYSGSDDKSVRVWDLATTTNLQTYKENSDYVRCGSKSSGGQLFVVGSYDKTIRLFDTRCSTSVLTLNHNRPVEDVVLSTTGNLISSAGGSSVKVWDVVAGGRLLTTFNNHHKTVTSLAFSMGNRRLVSASLDRHVKFYDLSSNKVVHSLDYPNPLLSIAFPLDDSMVAVGSSDAMLMVRTRKTDEEVVKEMDERRLRKRKRVVEEDGGGGGRGVVVVDSGHDVLLPHKMRELMPKYESRLKKFQHSRALDEALSHNLRLKHPEVAFSVMKELRRRRVLSASLAGRTDKQLSLLLTFLLKNLTPPHLPMMCDVISLILDLYKESIADMPQSKQLVQKLSRAFKDRSEFVKEGLELVGVINSVLIVSSLNS